MPVVPGDPLYFSKKQYEAARAASVGTSNSIFGLMAHLVTGAAFSFFLADQLSRLPKSVVLKECFAPGILNPASWHGVMERLKIAQPWSRYSYLEILPKLLATSSGSSVMLVSLMIVTLGISCYVFWKVNMLGSAMEQDLLLTGARTRAQAMLVKAFASGQRILYATFAVFFAYFVLLPIKRLEMKDFIQGSAIAVLYWLMINYVRRRIKDIEVYYSGHRAEYGKTVPPGID